ncbi:MAG: hypothetical protein LUQ38_10970 [Methanotrichaceae archaeon]|nr:hypothetical protein [Methanotrichaceae archaeon]
MKKKRNRDGGTSGSGDIGCLFAIPNRVLWILSEHGDKMERNRLRAKAGGVRYS